MGTPATVTEKLQLVLLPQVSLAVTDTRVVPMGKVLPLGGLATTLGGGLQPPLADTEKNTAAPLALVAVAVRLDEQFNTIGADVTVTVKLQVLVSRQLSLAVAYTVVVPMGKVLPLGGLAVTVGGLQPPLAVTEKNTVAPLALVAVAIRFVAGHLMVSGGVEACKITGAKNSRFAPTASKVQFVFMAEQELKLTDVTRRNTAPMPRLD